MAASWTTSGTGNCADPTSLSKTTAYLPRLARAVKAATGADGVRLMQFNEAPAGQSVFHVHFHIVPRWEGVPMAPHGKVMVEAAKLEPVAAKIRSEL